MTYIAADESTDGVAKVIYGSKDGKTSKEFERSSNASIYGMSVPNRLRARMTRQLKPSSSMISFHRPVRIIISLTPTIRLTCRGVVRPVGSQLKAKPKERRRKPTFKKNPDAAKTVSYARICLNPQLHLKKSILTTRPASVIWVGIGLV